DAGLDARAGRLAKPLAAGDVSPASVRTAFVVAALLCVPFSLALGLLPAVLHLVVVAAGWSYDLWLKRTAASPLPYFVAFGLLPLVAWGAAGAPLELPLALAAGMLGVAAHFANTVPDAVADAVTGVRGLPQRLGPHRSQRVAALGVVLACALPLVATRLPLPAISLLTAAAAVGVGSAVAAAHLSFRLTLVAAALAVAGVVVAG
ncbi:MAG: UbiA family prenyltransferase, partial [Actinomycetes bacterium]